MLLLVTYMITCNLTRACKMCKLNKVQNKNVLDNYNYCYCYYYYYYYYYVYKQELN
jgi:hypothetical protein